MDKFGRQGTACTGGDGRGTARQARYVLDGHGADGHGLAGKAGRGDVSSGEARQAR